MPPKQPAPKPRKDVAPSPRAPVVAPSAPPVGKKKADGALAPSPPKAAAPPPKSAVPSSGGGGENKGLLFAAFEGLIHIHPNEAKERASIAEEETALYAQLLLDELLEHLDISERESRELLINGEALASSELLFEESTNRQTVAAALLAKQSEVERRASIVDVGLGARIARKKSRLDAELQAEEARLAREASLYDPDAKKKALDEDRAKWLAQTEEVKAQLAEAEGEIAAFNVTHPPKKFELKNVAARRADLASKREKLEARLKKLEEMEKRYRQREAQEQQRVRRCSVLKGVDMGIISGEKNILHKATNLEIARKQEAQNELLDESMFRQMVTSMGDEFHRELRAHEEAEKQRVEQLIALHGSGPPPPKQPHPGPAGRRRRSSSGGGVGVDAGGGLAQNDASPHSSARRPQAAQSNYPDAASAEVPLRLPPVKGAVPPAPAAGSSTAPGPTPPRGDRTGKPAMSNGESSSPSARRTSTSATTELTATSSRNSFETEPARHPVPPAAPAAGHSPTSPPESDVVHAHSSRGRMSGDGSDGVHEEEEEEAEEEEADTS